MRLCRRHFLGQEPLSKSPISPYNAGQFNLLGRDQGMIKKLMVITAAVSLVLIWLLQAGVPLWVQQAFNAGSLDVLNRLTHMNAPQHLNVYLGRMEEMVWGPAVQGLSGILWLILALGPLKNVNGRIYFLCVLALLTAVKWNVLFFPPYGDSVGGPFAEGWWLARHHFDYAALYHQPGYAQGGPKVYFTSLFPTYLAVMYTVFSSVKVFLAANHLVFFALAAGVAAFIRSIGRRIFSAEVAGLTAALILSWPVFQSQMEALNMELPSLFFAVASAWALSRRRVHAAGVAALFSLLFKGSGVFACAAFFGFGLFELMADKDRSRRKAWALWGCGLIAAAVGVVAMKFVMGDQHARAGMIGFLSGWPSLRQFPLTYIYGLSAGALAVWAVIGTRRSDSFLSENLAFKTTLLMFIFAGMWFLLFLNFVAVSPRYRVAVYPFFLFMVIGLLTRIVPQRLIQILALSAAVIVVQFNAYGWRNAAIGTDYCLLEENLQYRGDLKLYQELARTVEAKYAGTAVVAPFISAQILAVPDFGYVRGRREVYIYGFNCTYGDIRRYPGMGGLEIGRTIYITMALDLGSKDMPYPVDPNDRVIDIVEWGNRKAWIFMGGFAIDRMKKIQEYLMLRQNAQVREKN
jgi:hypothetical protein